MNGRVMTVRGPIPPGELGLCMSHEHILTDLRPPDEQTSDYSREAVAARMLPFLLDARTKGVGAIAECTPMFLGRDPVLMRELSLRSGLHILVNTGQYKQPYLPPETYASGAAGLAARWIREFEDGIADGIRPGFIKTAVPENGLEPVNETVVRAAAIASRETGLTVGTHACAAAAARQVARILREEGLPLRKWIFIHAQVEENPGELLPFAGEGAYISFDGLCRESREKHLAVLALLVRSGFEDRVLLSHDAGWYSPGRPDGGDVRGYTYALDEFMGYAGENGVDPAAVRRILTRNPQEAFTIGS